MQEVMYENEPAVDKYARVTVPAGSFCKFRERAGQAYKYAVGPCAVWFTKTKTGAVNGTVENCKVMTFGGEILTEASFEKKY